MNTATVEEVNGQLIGPYMIRGGLFYKGRMQGQMFYAEADDQVVVAGKARLEEIKADCGEAYTMIYSDKNAWTVRIYGH